MKKSLISLIIVLIINFNLRSQQIDDRIHQSPIVVVKGDNNAPISIIANYSCYVCIFPDSGFAYFLKRKDSKKIDGRVLSLDKRNLEFKSVRKLKPSLLLTEIGSSRFVYEQLKIGDLFIGKIMLGMYTNYESIDGKYSLVKAPFTKDELKDFAVLEIGEVHDHRRLIRQANKFYFVTEDFKAINRTAGNDALKYDFATNYVDGRSLVGDLTDDGEIKYGFIDANGLEITGRVYRKVERQKGLFFLWRSNGIELYDSTFKLICGDLHRYFQSNRTMPILRDFGLDDRECFKGLDVLDKDGKFRLYKALWGEYVIMDQPRLKYSRFFTKWSFGKEFENFKVISNEFGVILINSKLNSISEEFNQIDALPEGIGLVVDKNHRKNLTINGREKLFSDDYAEISVKDGNAVCNNGSNGQSDRYLIRKGKAFFYDSYSSLTQFDCSGVGFWSKGKPGTLRLSGFYTSKGLDTLPRFNCTNLAGRTNEWCVEQYSGFGPGEVAVLSGPYIGSALINRKMELIVPFDCNKNFENISITQDSTRTAVTITLTAPSRPKFSFLVENGKQIGKRYSEIVPIANSKLYKVACERSTLYAILNDKGQELTGFDFFSISNCDNGRIMVKKPMSGHLVDGIYSDSGKEIVPCIFIDISRSSNGFYICKEFEKRWSVFDSIGNKLSRYLPYSEVNYLHENLLKVSDGKLVGIVSFQNEHLVKPICESIFWDDRLSQIICKFNGTIYILRIVEISGLGTKRLECESGDCSVLFEGR